MTSLSSFSGPRSPEDDAGSEQRGFALYVGLSASKAREHGLELSEIVSALRQLLSRRIPLAESHALEVYAPADASANDLDVVIQVSAELADEPVSPSTASRPPDSVGVVIDLARHRVLVEDREVHLSFKEFALLQALVVADGGTLSRAQLRRAISTSEEVDVNDRTIDVLIRRLRVRLGEYPALVQTQHGAGYRFNKGRSVSVLTDYSI